MLMQGHARDIMTGHDGAIEILDEDMLTILASPQREILEIGSQPDREMLSELIGCRAGGHSRSVLAEVLRDEKAAGTPLYLLLDDFAGASLVAGWAWRNWVEDWGEQFRKNTASSAGKSRSMEGICAGFRPGASSLNPDGTSVHHIQSSAKVPSLVNTNDPDGWHELRKQDGVGMRRARRVDIWMDHLIHIDVGFQDSGTSPDDGRIAVHEYQVAATADPESFELLSISVDPRILPYRECPAASPNASRLIGSKLTNMREEVLETLKGTAGCTHLNDVLRSMAEVPQLTKHFVAE